MQIATYITIGVLALLAFLVYSSQDWSSVTVTHVKDGEVSPGIHFYEPRPYLLVTKTEGKDATDKLTSTFTSQIIWLPDHSRRFKVEIKSGWGTVNGSVKLQNGWMLDTLGAQMDSKIPETIAAAGGLLTAVISKEPPTRAMAGLLSEGLYKITIDAEGEVSFQRTGQETR